VGVKDNERDPQARCGVTESLTALADLQVAVAAIRNLATRLRGAAEAYGDKGLPLAALRVFAGSIKHECDRVDAALTVLRRLAQLRGSKIALALADALAGMILAAPAVAQTAMPDRSTCVESMGTIEFEIRIKYAMTAEARLHDEAMDAMARIDAKQGRAQDWWTVARWRDWQRARQAGWSTACFDDFTIGWVGFNPLRNFLQP